MGLGFRDPKTHAGRLVPQARGYRVLGLAIGYDHDVITHKCLALGLMVWGSGLKNTNVRNNELL